MKRLLEQLTMLRGGARAIEEAMPALADDCTYEDVQRARDLMICTVNHLNGVDEELAGEQPHPEPEINQLRRTVAEMRHALREYHTEEQLDTAYGAMGREGVRA